jgi:hypothetical protein
MVLPIAAFAPKIIIPSFFIAHKVRNEKDTAKMFLIFGFTIMFAATVIILFQDRMPWIAIITAMSAVLFHQMTEGIESQKTFIYALSLAIMGLTFYGEGCSPLAFLGFIVYIASYFAVNPVSFTVGHVVGLLGFSYGVHDPSFLKEITSIGEHLA